MTLIDQIIVSFVNDTTFNASCAMMNDLVTVEVLYVSTYNIQTRQQITIQPKFIPDPGSSGVLNITEIAYISYGTALPGEEALLCASSL